MLKFSTKIVKVPYKRKLWSSPVFLNLFEFAAHFLGKINFAAHLGINKGKNRTGFRYFIWYFKIWRHTWTNSTAHMGVAAHRLRTTGLVGSEFGSQTKGLGFESRPLWFRWKLCQSNSGPQKMWQINLFGKINKA